MILRTKRLVEGKHYISRLGVIVSPLMPRLDLHFYKLFQALVQTNKWLFANTLRQFYHGTSHIQSNFNGSNTFGTMKISSRQG